MTLYTVIPFVVALAVLGFAMRSGKISLREMNSIRTDENPILFWASIGIPMIVCVGVLGFVFWELFSK